jgi:uracil-DNA glycosylase
LCFGVNRGNPIPNALDNIINELETGMNEPDWDEKTKQIIRKEYQFVDRTNATLEGWAKQGVLLLNSCLTTEDGIAGAHQDIGWERFTDQIILSIKQRNKPTVYMLWGDLAKQKYQRICEGRGDGTVNSLVIESTHPSPLTYNRGPLQNRFMGSRPFNKANRFFGSKGLKLIDWFKTGG